MQHKLSASALNQFLRSPKAYYYGYVARLEPILPSVGTFDEAKLFGILWAEYVDRFYKGVAEAENITQTRQAWHEKIDGWVPEKKLVQLTKALDTLMPQYYQQFSPTDGVRNGSELHLENDRFIAYLDGLSHDGVVHEVKTTSRSPQLAEQLWKVQHSIQVKLYAVMAKANGIRIEFAFKDSPYQIYRSEILPVTPEQRMVWESELNTLADSIYALGDDPSHYPCHTDGCTLTTKYMVSTCPYQSLCDSGLTDMTKILYKEKKHREAK